jgi:hypothetical protein
MGFHRRTVARAVACAAPRPSRPPSSRWGHRRTVRFSSTITVSAAVSRGPVRCGRHEQVHGILLGIPGEQGHQVAAQGVAELPGAAEAFQGAGPSCPSCGPDDCG